MTNLPFEFEEKLTLLKLNYLKSLKEKQEILDSLNLKLKDIQDYEVPDSLVILREVYQHVHKLSGSSAIFGFANISEASHKAEVILKQTLDGNNEFDSENFFINLDNMLDIIAKILKEEGT